MKKIIIFDSHPLFEKYILNDINLKTYVVQEKPHPNFIVNKFFRILLYLKFFYLIKILNIKLVVSTIYNSVFISKMINLFPNTNFLTVQNYTTFENEQSNLKKLNLGILLCFGEAQKKIFKAKHNVKKIEIIGSPTYSIFNLTKPQNINKKFKICYVSQWTPDSLKNKNDLSDPKIYNILKLETNLKKYLLKYNYNIVFALRENLKSNEYDYFYSNFKDRGLINIRKNYFDTYELMRNSEVVLSGWSTCAYEIFADNNKVLFNSYKSKDLQLFSNDTCVINNEDFKEFEKKLNNLLEMSKEEFLNKTYQEQNKIIDKNCLQNSHLKIKEFVELNS